MPETIPSEDLPDCECKCRHGYDDDCGNKGTIVIKAVNARSRHIHVCPDCFLNADRKGVEYEVVRNLQ